MPAVPRLFAPFFQLDTGPSWLLPPRPRLAVVHMLWVGEWALLATPPFTFTLEGPRPRDFALPRPSFDLQSTGEGLPSLSLGLHPWPWSSPGCSVPGPRAEMAVPFHREDPHSSLGLYISKLWLGLLSQFSCARCSPLELLIFHLEAPLTSRVRGVSSSTWVPSADTPPPGP